LPIPNPQSAIQNPPSAIRHPQSKIRNPKSEIRNPRSKNPSGLRAGPCALTTELDNHSTVIASRAAAKQSQCCQEEVASAPGTLLATTIAIARAERMLQPTPAIPPGAPRLCNPPSYIRHPPSAIRHPKFQITNAHWAFKEIK
jgi:hypothetical protein